MLTALETPGRSGLRHVRNGWKIVWRRSAKVTSRQAVGSVHTGDHRLTPDPGHATASPPAEQPSLRPRSHCDGSGILGDALEHNRNARTLCGQYPYTQKTTVRFFAGENACRIGLPPGGPTPAAAPPPTGKRVRVGVRVNFPGDSCWMVRTPQSDAPQPVPINESRRVLLPKDPPVSGRCVYFPCSTG